MKSEWKYFYVKAQKELPSDVSHQVMEAELKAKPTIMF